MSRVLSKAQLKTYILTKLGDPVIEVNIADEQLDAAISDSLLFFQEYHYLGTNRVYIARKITQQDIDNKWVPTPEGLMTVVKVMRPPNNSMGFSGGDTLFDLRYQFFANEIWSLTRGGGNFSNFYILQQYLHQINDIFSFEVRHRFSPVEDRLYIDSNWNRHFKVDSYLVYEAYQVVDPEEYNQLYDNLTLKSLCVAEAKKQWGQNLSKWNGVQLPGGVTLNGQQMYQDAVIEIDKIKQDFIMKFSEPLEFMIG